MILRLSVLDASTSLAQDIEVTAEPNTSVASLLASLPVRLGARTCYMGARPLDPDAIIADTPLVSGATISVGAAGPDPRALPGRAVGALRVLAGPDAGLVAWLPAGTHLVGRDASAAVRLRAQETSRRHAQVEVSPQGRASVVDLGSANGTTVDGVPATEPVPLTERAELEICANQMQWVPLTAAQSTTTRSADGRLEFHRAFAPAPAIPRIEVALPTAEINSRNVAALLLSALLPLAIGGVLAVVAKQPAMLLFALLGPVSVLGTTIIERRQRKDRDRVYIEASDAAYQQITNQMATEQRLRHQLAPDELDLTLAATGMKPGLWPRNADSSHGLVLRVGIADQPASVDLRGEPGPGFEAPVLPGAPVTVDLRITGVLGVVGTGEPVKALLRWLLVQLATLRSPDELRIVIISSTEDPELAWAGWLPHVATELAGDIPCWVGNTPQTRAARITELKELVTARTAQRGSASTMRFNDEIVVVLDGALALRHLPGMKEVLREGPSVGIYVLCADRQGMNECHGLCDLGTTSLRLTRTRDEHPSTACPEGLSRNTAERLARALAPMRDRLTLAATQNAIPYPVRFLDLLGVATPTADDVLTSWKAQPGPTTDVVLGADASGPVTVDLARQGPHTMLGGATGAGKSILLQTLVTSLLLANRPDELNLVLVDFKGGGAFLPFQHCPHVVGLIRSTGETPADVFDEAAAARVLASVRTEVRRRESLLARYGGEIDHYWRAHDTTPTMSPLPRLVMIFDEFARVLETSPDFLKELVNVAAKGRSLGMHLILATQSLQGKLSPELKNNIDLRITLRQNEPADSIEVLGVADAATIPGRLRGRGMILCTKDETRTPRPFQSGYLGNPPAVAGAVPAQVRIVGWPTLGLPRPDQNVDHGDKLTDQQLAITAIEKAGPRTGVPAPFRPLLPPLPAALSLDELTVKTTTQAPATAVEFGLLDDPAGQAQPPAQLDLAGTDRLLIAGGPQSGRTTAAHTLIASLATRFRPDQAHLYVLEQHPAGLAAYTELTHCGAVFSPAEPDRIRRFITWLDSEVQHRGTTRFSQPANPPPWIVVLIDGWEHFENRSDPNFVETSLLTTLRGIITAGTPLGIHMVVLGGQDMVMGKLPALYSQRLLLPFPKEDTRRGNLSVGMVSPPVLPGRAIDSASGQHIQICQPSLSPPDLIQRANDQAGSPDPTRLPRQFRPLPTKITVGQLSLPEPAPSPTWTPLGVGGAEATTIGIDLLDPGPHILLISGPSTSGRTTAAAALAHGLRRVDIGVLAIAPPRSPLPDLLPAGAGVRVLTGTTLKDSDLREAATAFADGPYAVIVDDCEQITVTPSQEGFSDAPTLLDDIVNPGSLGHRALVMCGDAQPILTGQRRSLMRITNEILTSGARLLLTPTNRTTAREHGYTLEPDQYFAGPPGRGYLTTGRTTDLIQLAQHE
ncbi:MAG: FtsK/SpoIIIE domain-containing protein [Actinomycetota bacterium]|nr:FtsK/SpoIIIE domain-containing protein [Actinomycetota bacterium]